jgi:hypothetical protein
LEFYVQVLICAGREYVGYVGITLRSDMCRERRKLFLGPSGLAASDHVLGGSLEMAVYFGRGGGTTDLPRGKTRQVLLV